VTAEKLFKWRDPGKNFGQGTAPMVVKFRGKWGGSQPSWEKLEKGRKKVTEVSMKKVVRGDPASRGKAILRKNEK